jgi:hypothetical protein
MSERFERWKQLATQCLYEQDPAKLTALANEMNLAVKANKTPYLDPTREKLEQPALGPKEEGGVQF